MYRSKARKSAIKHNKMTDNYAKGGEVEKLEANIKKLETLEKSAKDKGRKALYQKGIEKAKAQLKKAKEADKKDNKPKSKAKSKSAAKKDDAPKDKKEKGLKHLSSKRVSIDGKEVDLDSSEFCDYLLKQFKDRRDAAKSKKGKKTTSVMERVAANIEKGIAQAIKAGVKQKKAEIEKDPKKFIGRVQKLETSTKNFLEDLKGVLGNQYDSEEVKDTVSSIHKLVEELKKKMS